MRRGHVIAGLLCAWVLWENIIVSGSQQANAWAILDAREVLSQCEAVMRGFKDSEKTKSEKEGATVTVHPRAVTVKRENREEFIRYFCLPAGTDPRPRTTD